MLTFWCKGWRDIRDSVPVTLPLAMPREKAQVSSHQMRSMTHRMCHSYFRPRLLRCSPASTVTMAMQSAWLAATCGKDKLLTVDGTTTTTTTTTTTATITTSWQSCSLLYQSQMMSVVAMQESGVHNQLDHNLQHNAVCQPMNAGRFSWNKVLQTTHFHSST